MFQKLSEIISSVNKSKTVNLLILLFIVAAIPVTVFVARKQQEIRQRAQFANSCATFPRGRIGEKPDPQKAQSVSVSLELTNRNLARAVQTYKSSSGFMASRIRSQIIGLTITRKNQMIEVMRLSPDRALKNLISEQNRPYIASLTKNCMESKTSLEGILSVEHADFFEDHISANYYTLTKQSGEKIQIHPSNLSENLISGSKINIKEGYLLDNDYVFDAGLINNLIIVQSVSIAPSILVPTEKIAVLLINFRNVSEEDLSKDEANDIVFNQTSNYYLENSYGKTKIEGNIYGWYTLDNLDQTCDIEKIDEEAIKRGDLDINYTEYNNGTIIIIAPFGPNCGWSGLGTIGKEKSIQTQEGLVEVAISRVKSSKLSESPYIVGHEFGHALTLKHANFFGCGSKSLSLSNCFADEYGDIYDIMGAGIKESGIVGNFGHMNAPHKEYMGYFKQGNLLTVTTNGNYTLEPIETSSFGLKALKIPRGSNRPSDFIYVEYKQPILFDNKLNVFTNIGSDVFEGALLHLGGPLAETNLLDAYVPELMLGNSLTPALPVDNIFIDPLTGTTVNVVNKSTSSLTVNVSLGKTDTTAPSVTITNPKHGQLVSGTTTIEVLATDNVGIDKVEFYASYNGSTTLIHTDNTSPYSFTVDTSLVPTGDYILYVKAYDTSGNQATSPLIKVTVVRQTTPTNPPTGGPTPTQFLPTPTSASIPSNLTVIYPYNYAYFKRGTTITTTVNVSDSIGIDRVEYSFSGSVVCASKTQPYSCNFIIPTFLPPGYGYLTVTAYNLANKSSSKTITLILY